MLSATEMDASALRRMRAHILQAQGKMGSADDVMFADEKAGYARISGDIAEIELLLHKLVAKIEEEIARVEGGAVPATRKRT